MKIFIILTDLKVEERLKELSRDFLMIQNVIKQFKVYLFAFKLKIRKKCGIISKNLFKCFDFNKKKNF
jgi:hypothetical protein